MYLLLLSFAGARVTETFRKGIVVDFQLGNLQCESNNRICLAMRLCVFSVSMSVRYDVCCMFGASGSRLVRIDHHSSFSCGNSLCYLYFYGWPMFPQWIMARCSRAHGWCEDCVREQAKSAAENQHRLNTHTHALPYIVALLWKMMADTHHIAHSHTEYDLYSQNGSASCIRFLVSFTEKKIVFIHYLFVLICGYGNEFGLLEHIRAERWIGQLQYVVGSYQMKTWLILVHRIQNRLQKKKEQRMDYSLLLASPVFFCLELEKLNFNFIRIWIWFYFHYT